MTIDEIQEQIIDQFALLGDAWEARYEYLIELARELAPFAPEHRTDQYVIRGCQSRVWVDARLGSIGGERGKVYFSADSDALITKGIISLLIRVLNGHTPTEILAAELYFIDRIGLSQNLSPTRANGLVAMIRQMNLFATAFEAIQHRTEQTESPQ